MAWVGWARPRWRSSTPIATRGYDLVWWVSAEETGLIGEQYAALAIELDLASPRSDTASAVGVLRGHGRWLLVLDKRWMRRFLPAAAQHRRARAVGRRCRIRSPLRLAGGCRGTRRPTCGSAAAPSLLFCGHLCRMRDLSAGVRRGWGRRGHGEVGGHGVRFRRG